MRPKYLVRSVADDEFVLGVRFDPDKSELVVGGRTSHTEAARRILNAFVPFQWGGPHLARDESRMRFTVECSQEEWSDGLEHLKRLGYRLEPVRCFRRLMS